MEGAVGLQGVVTSFAMRIFRWVQFPYSPPNLLDVMRVGNKIVDSFFSKNIENAVSDSERPRFRIDGKPSDKSLVWLVGETGHHISLRTINFGFKSQADYQV